MHTFAVGDCVDCFKRIIKKNLFVTMDYMQKFVHIEAAYDDVKYLKKKTFFYLFIW